MTAVLEARNLSCGYGALAVVRGVDLEINAGEIVALLGPNGAGKTTTVRTLSGLLKPLAGEVWLEGARTRTPLHRRAKKGVSWIPEDRGVFPKLTVGENIRIGRGHADQVTTLFPALKPLMRRQLGLCSGGEQQMVAVARALARDSKVLLVDEMSLGLAPLIVAKLMDTLRVAAEENGLGVLLIEQHVRQALRIADRAYVMNRGEITMSGPADYVQGRLSEIEAGYLSGPESP
jgi:branched-chain amino acid transport system ATP-binding protein